MNRKKQLHNGQKRRADFRPQVLITLALLVTIIHLVSPSFINWLHSTTKEVFYTDDQYIWISRADGTSGLYRSEKSFIANTLGPAAISIGSDGRSTPIDLPARVAPFFFLPIPLNRADSELLMTLPGIGPKLAERIITLRQEKGRFDSVDELLQIPGISKRKLSSLASLIHCE